MADSSYQTGWTPPRAPPVARPFQFLVLSGIALLLALLASTPPIRIMSIGAGAGLLATAIILWSFEARNMMRFIIEHQILSRLVHASSEASFVSDADGVVKVSNTLAIEELDAKIGAQTSTVLTRHIASGASVVERLVDRAKKVGRSSERISTCTGLVLTEVVSVARGRFLWRVTKLERNDLVSAFAGSTPYLSIAADGNVLAANAAARSILEDQNVGIGADVAVLGHDQVVLFKDDTRTDIILSPQHEADFGAGKNNLRSSLAMNANTPDVLHGLPVPVLQIAPSGRVLTANEPARKLLGLNGEEFPPLYDLVEGMGRPISEWLSDAVDGRGLLKPEFVRATSGAKDLYLQISLGRIEEGGETRLIGILNDATELKTLEAQFVQSQKMQAIGQLAGGVAHDFNNLLTAISGHCDLLLLRHDQGDLDYSDLMQIAQNANRAASLVGQLLAFSRKQTLKPTSLDLHDVMSDLAHLLNRLIGEKVSLNLRFEQTDRVIRADRRQLEQVIMNLVVNARDAMPEGGEIHVRGQMADLSEPLERDRASVPEGQWIVLEVSDSGEGIDPEKLPKIFEPFYTTKKTGEGTGLGLSTAYGIVKQTGGFIFAESVVGEGTTFTLYFPAHLRSHDETIAPVAAKPEPLGKQGDGIILLVEDEAPVRAFASRALRMRGYTVLEAENAEAALETLQNKDLEIDIFVTDVIMPGMDGPSWVREALKDRPDTKVVFVSGYAEESLAENQSRIPNSVFLPKPFSLSQLNSVVQQQLA